MDLDTPIEFVFDGDEKYPPAENTTVKNLFGDEFLYVSKVHFYTASSSSTRNAEYSKEY